MAFSMTTATIKKLEEKNGELLQLVVRLCTFILRSAVEQRELVHSLDAENAQRQLAAVVPRETVTRLREVAVLCTQLSLEGRDQQTCHALEQLGIELAAEAEGLEPAFRIANPNG
jgi:hypothetical protein